MNAADVSVTNQDTAGPTISSVLVVEQTGPRNGELTTSESLLLTFHAEDADGVAGATVQVDGHNVAAVYGPYPAASGVNFSAVLGTYSTGTHNYSIVANDMAGNPTSPAYTGTFDVVAEVIVGPTISSVVLGEAVSGSDHDGTLETSRQAAANLDGVRLSRLSHPIGKDRRPSRWAYRRQCRQWLLFAPSGRSRRGTTPTPSN